MPSDLRDAIRSLARDRGFTALAVLLLALTGGATTAVYAIVHAVLLEPFPLAEPHRTVVIWEYDTARSTPVVEVGRGEVDAWRPSEALESLAVFGSVNAPITIVEGDRRTRASSSWVSAPFFDVVGIPPALGRAFNATDESDEAPRTAVVSDAFWNRHLGADPGVVGRTLRIQRGVGTPTRPIEIVGVMPAGFEFPRGVDVWLPAAPILRSIASGVPGDRAGNVAWYLDYFKVFYALGRLRDDIPLERARQELTRMMHLREIPTGMPSGVVVTPVRDYLVGPTQPVLWTMLAGGVLMVALACSSVAGLHLFRAARQDRALAIQLALGAERRRLVRRAILESTILASAGAMLAFFVAWGLARLLIGLAPSDVPRLAATTVFAPSIVVVAAGLALATSVVSGVWPAVFVGRVDPARVLTSGARTAMLPRERLLQRLVVGWQVAVAVILLTGSALFIRSVQRLERTPLGFTPGDLVAIELQPSAGEFAQWDQFFESLSERVAELPAVRAVGAIARRPLSGPIGNDTIPVLKGQEGLGPDAPWRQNPRANLQAVTPGYFRAVGARLIAGRDFTDADVAIAPNVVIVGASTAARFWPDRDPVGELMLVPTQRLPGSLETPRWQVVVGVAEDVRYRGIIDPRLDVYMPAAQSTIRVGQVLVRTSGPPSQVIADVQQIAHALDPAVLTGEVVTLADVVAQATAPWRFAMRVLTAFGVLAAVLAAVGLAGLVSLIATLRRRELGIRAALGASPNQLRVHVLSEVMWVAVVAASLGILASLAAGRLIAGLLVDIPPHDPLSLAAAAVVTMALAAAGCLGPSRRASGTDPAEALRE
jgi:predicted permease